MAVQGKKAYKLYLDEENIEFLKSYLDRRRASGGLSALVDKYLARCVFMVKENQDIFDNLEPGKLKFNKLMQLMKITVKMQDEWKDQPFDLSKKKET